MELGHTVWNSGFTFHGDIITGPDVADDAEVLPMLERGEQVPAILPPPDVVILRLFDQNEADSIRLARHNGQIVLCDLDDDVWNMPEWNGVRAYLKRDGKWVYPKMPRKKEAPRSIDLACLEANYAACDGVLCSTPRVAQAVKENVPFVNTFVCRNGIPADEYAWPRPVTEHQKLRVAWMGVTSAVNHVGFLDILDDLTELLAEYNCEFWHLGAEKESPPIVKWFPQNWSQPVRMVPWASNKILPWLLSEIDVGIICRRPHQFHEGQSNVSGLAYGAAGVPYVVSRTVEYQILEGLGCGVCYEHPDGFRNALEPLLASEELRTSMREHGRAVAVNHFNPRTVARQWEQAIEAVRDSRAATV